VKPRTKLAAAVAAFSLVLVACGDDKSTDAAASADGPKIVSLSPTGTEMLFAIGAGDLVVAADSYSNYPAEAPTTDLSAYEPNAEAIAGYEPDLVVLSNDSADGIVKQLEALEIETLLLPAAATIDDTYSELEQLGAATGHVGDAAEVVANMQADIEEIVTSATPRPAPLTYYHELDNTYYSVTSSTFIGQVYSLLGLENIADAADDGSAGGYPQLTAEAIIAADPDLVFLADTKCCQQDAAAVAARPGWDTLSAVKAGNVVELDDDVASRWGPRIVDLMKIVAAAVEKVPAA
jgi:iron complex transport system substrate-binding protein